MFNLWAKAKLFIALLSLTDMDPLFYITLEILQFLIQGINTLQEI